jgi:hypothetical protein
MRVIVAGATGWTNGEAIRREICRLPADAVVIHGDSAGADAIAGRIATELGRTVEAWRKEKQDYERFKKAAWKGLNERMLAASVDLVLAFHQDLSKSRGTKHLVEWAQKRRVTVRVFAE